MSVKRRRRLALGLLGLATAGVLGWAWLALRPTLSVQTTPSMLSRVPVGSLVVAVRTPWSAIHPGEVLVFTEPGTKDVTVAHYVLARHRDYLITHSALSQDPDAWAVVPRDVDGRAVAIVPGLGWAWADPMVWLMLVAGLALAVALPKRSQRLGALAAGLSAAGVAWLRTRPLVGFFPIAEPTVDHHAELIGVSTGLLRERVRLRDDDARSIVHVAEGHLVRLSAVAHGGERVHWEASASLATWAWVVVVLALLVPAIVGVVNARIILSAEGLSAGTPLVSAGGDGTRRCCGPLSLS